MNKNHLFMLKILFSFLLRSRSQIFVGLTGIAIGATIFLSMLALCYDIPKHMSREFRSYGANLVLLPTGNETHFSYSQAKEALTHLPQDRIIGLSPYRYERMRSSMIPYMVSGVDFAAIQKINPYWRVTGSWPQNDHEILIGSDIAEVTRFEPGRELILEGRNREQQRYEKKFVISGIVQTGGPEDGFIFIPIKALEMMSGEQDRVDVIELSIAANGEELKQFSSSIRSPTSQFFSRQVKRVTRAEEAVSGKLEALIYLVTVIVLFLTMICVATTMMTIIMERRKEIGLKKALGASNQTIAKNFLLEAALLGLFGGIIGAILGFFAAENIILSVFNRSITLSFSLIPITLLVSIIVSILASLLPVRKAVAINPALVLKGE